MSRSQRHRDRLLQGPGAVFSLAKATELLPMGDQQALGWLVNEGLVHQLDGRGVVVWGEVVDRIRESPPNAAKPTTPPAPRTRRTHLSRKKLEPI